MSGTKNLAGKVSQFIAGISASNSHSQLFRCTTAFLIFAFFNLPDGNRTLAGTIVVSTSGDDLNDGLTWATAKRTIQAGLDTAVPGDQVWVAQGTYAENITLAADVGLYGGLAGNETPGAFSLACRRSRENMTVVQGYSPIGVPSGASASTRLDGFVIRGQAGHSILINMSSPTIANNVFTDGAGVHLLTSSSLILGNIFKGTGGNDHPVGGGAISCVGGSPMIINNTIAGNDQVGLRLWSSTPALIANNLIAFNRSGVFRVDGSATVTHNCVFGNDEYDYSSNNPTGISGNISVDPRLVDLRYGNCHVQPDSPCIGAGDSSVVPAGVCEMDGDARVLGVSIDIGADESDGSQWPSGPYIVVRVAPDGQDGYSGDDWQAAKRTIGSAIDIVSLQGGEVWVKAGLYEERIRIWAYSYLLGGFRGDELERNGRDWRRNETIVSGAGTFGPIIAFAPGGKSASGIDGFTIRDGTAYAGGAILCVSTSPEILNNRIVGNEAISGQQRQGSGGGLYLSSSSARVLNNEFYQNAAPYFGEPFFRYGGSAVYAGYCRGAVIANNVFAGNYVWGTKSEIGFSVLMTEGSALFVGNTVYGGETIPLECFRGQFIVANSILTSGPWALIVQQAPVLRNNCIVGEVLGIQDPWGVNGNISAAPRFARNPSDGGDGWGDDPATPDIDEGGNDDFGELRLTLGSPCIDAGSNSDVPLDMFDLDGDGDRMEPLPVDIRGRVRFFDDVNTPDTGMGVAPIVDIGAYEFTRGVPSATSAVPSVLP